MENRENEDKQRGDSRPSLFPDQIQQREKKIEPDQGRDVPVKVISVDVVVDTKDIQQVVQLGPGLQADDESDGNGDEIQREDPREPVGIETGERILLVRETQPVSGKEQEDIHADIADIERPDGVIDPAEAMEHDHQQDGDTHQVGPEGGQFLDQVGQDPGAFLFCFHTISQTVFCPGRSRRFQAVSGRCAWPGKG